MEKKQYSNEFLARVYGAYWGCECVQCPGTKQETKGRISSLSNLPFYERNNTQLILTPLSKITDEHAIKIAWLSRKLDAAVDVPFHVIFDNNRSMHIVRNDTDSSICYPLTSECIDTLRDWGYDCGYEDISSLIDAGIAIEKQ